MMNTPHEQHDSESAHERRAGHEAEGTSIPAVYLSAAALSVILVVTMLAVWMLIGIFEAATSPEERVLGRRRPAIDRSASPGRRSARGRAAARRKTTDAIRVAE